MSATDLDGADDGTVGVSAGDVMAACALAGCEHVVTTGSPLCLVHTVVAELTP